MWFWPQIPIELQRMILDYLILMVRPTSNNHGGVVGRPLAKKPPLLQYAAVCSAWRKYFEPYIYSKLFLTSSSLPVLRWLTSQQLRHVRYVWLAIELDGHFCDACFGRQTIVCGVLTDHDIVKRDLHSLFQQLGRFRAGADGRPANITLELSMFCRKDTQHAFRNDLHFDTCPTTRLGELEDRRPALHDALHGWEKGERVRPPTDYSVQNLIRPVKRALARWNLTEVTAVSSFIMRRQTRRHVAQEIIQDMFDRLPNLTSVIYEPWRNSPMVEMLRDDLGYLETIAQHIPRTVKNLILFEDSRLDFLDATAPGLPDWYWRAPRHAVVEQGIVELHDQLETLALSWVVDAYSLLELISRRARPWPALTSLHLTSRHLHPRLSTPDKANRVVALAAQAVALMPALKTMVLWCGEQFHANKFRFRVDEHNRASIRWRGTWPLELSSETIWAWKVAARERTGSALVVEDPVIEDASCDIWSRGAAILRLGLGGQVVHPASLEQICCETSRSYSTCTCIT